jgi:hypothetical protein
LRLLRDVHVEKLARRAKSGCGPTVSVREAVVSGTLGERGQDVKGMGLVAAGIQADHHGERVGGERFSGGVISGVESCTG